MSVGSALRGLGAELTWCTVDSRVISTGTYNAPISLTHFHTAVANRQEVLNERETLHLRSSYDPG